MSLCLFFLTERTIYLRTFGKKAPGLACPTLLPAWIRCVWRWWWQVCSSAAAFVCASGCREKGWLHSQPAEGQGTRRKASDTPLSSMPGPGLSLHVHAPRPGLPHSRQQVDAILGFLCFQRQGERWASRKVVIPAVSLPSCGELTWDGESSGCVFLRVTNQTLVWLGMWKGKLTQRSGKQFKYCLSHRVQRCWFLAFRQPYLSAWSLVGLLWFRLSDHPHWWQSGGRGAEPRQEAFGDVLNAGSGHYASLSPVARLGCPCSVRVRRLHPGPEPLAVASTSYPSRAWPQPPSALPGWFPIYWTSLYFLLALKFMIFFSPTRNLGRRLCSMGKKPSQKSKEPTYELGPWLVLGDVLAQYLRASRQVVLGKLTRGGHGLLQMLLW